MEPEKVNNTTNQTYSMEDFLKSGDLKQMEFLMLMNHSSKDAEQQSSWTDQLRRFLRTVLSFSHVALSNTMKIKNNSESKKEGYDSEVRHGVEGKKRVDNSVQEGIEKKGDTPEKKKKEMTETLTSEELDLKLIEALCWLVERWEKQKMLCHFVKGANLAALLEMIMRSFEDVVEYLPDVPNEEANQLKEKQKPKIETEETPKKEQQKYKKVEQPLKEKGFEQQKDKKVETQIDKKVEQQKNKKSQENKEKLLKLDEIKKETPETTIFNKKLESKKGETTDNKDGLLSLSSSKKEDLKVNVKAKDESSSARLSSMQVFLGQALHRPVIPSPSQRSRTPSPLRASFRETTPFTAQPTYNFQPEYTSRPTYTPQPTYTPKPVAPKAPSVSPQPSLSSSGSVFVKEHYRQGHEVQGHFRGDTWVNGHHRQGHMVKAHYRSKK